MQQRLGLAVALVAGPELVVLDEPTSALDPLGRADVRDIVLELKSRGVAVLLNSHLIGEVERVCDRVVILDRGRVAASGTLAELLGQRELHLHLSDLSPAAEARLAATGKVERTGDWFTAGAVGRRRGTRPFPTWCATWPPSAYGCTRSSPRGSPWRSACSASCETAPPPGREKRE